MLIFLALVSQSNWHITPRTSQEIDSSSVACQVFWFPRGNVEAGGYRALAQAGVKWVRLPLPWSSCETDTGVYFFDHISWIVDTLNAMGIEVYMCIGDNNPLYDTLSPSTSRPYVFSRFMAFVDTSAKLFRDRVGIWEFWNEANIEGVWGPYDPADYTATACSTAAHIRAVDPDAFTVLTGTALVDVPFITACLKAGAGQFYDAVAFHPYRAWPEIGQDTCVSGLPNPDFTSPFSSYEQEIEALRDTVARYAPGLKLWDTEGAYWSDTILPAPLTPDGLPLEWTENTQAKYLARRYLMNMGLGIDMTTWTLDWDFHSLYGNMGREDWIDDYRNEHGWPFGMAPFFGITYTHPDSLNTFWFQGENPDSLHPSMQVIPDPDAENLACVGIPVDSPATGEAYYTLSLHNDQYIFWSRCVGHDTTHGFFTAQLDTLSFWFGNWFPPDSYRWQPSQPLDIGPGDTLLRVQPLFSGTRFDAGRFTRVPSTVNKKASWWTMAYIASVFDKHTVLDSVAFAFSNITADTSYFNHLQAFEFVDTVRRAHWLTYWFGTEALDTRAPDTVSLRINRTDITEPYLVDFLTGQAVQITDFSVDDTSTLFPMLPANDYPLAVAWGGYVSNHEAGEPSLKTTIMGNVVCDGFLRVLSPVQGRAQVYDITGRKSIELELQKGKNRVWLQGLGPGVYFLVIKGTRARRFVVIR